MRDALWRRLGSAAGRSERTAWAGSAAARGEARGAGAGAELEDAQRALRGGRAREEERRGGEHAEEGGGRWPELEGEAEGREGADGDRGRERGEVEVVELRV